jgi:hypothetical protein
VGIKYCPNCKNEFQDWANNCIDCGAELVDENTPGPNEKPYWLQDRSAQYAEETAERERFNEANKAKLEPIAKPKPVVSEPVNLAKQMETLNVLEKLSDLKEKGILSEEEYKAKRDQIINSENAPVKKGFPGTLFLLPIFLGTIGGITGAIIAVKVYKSKWWQMIVVGIIMNLVWYAIYKAI